MTILLVRHGETEWNVARRNQGRLDSPLTERGRAQARAVGQWLARLPQAAAAPIVSSPLGRARATAAIIREQMGGTAALTIDERLRELSIGDWDGLTYAEIAALAPGLFAREGPLWWFGAPGGEDYDTFSGRLAAWLGEQDEGGVRIVVTHGLVSRVLRGLYLRLPPAEALALPVPQHRLFRLAGSKVETIRVPGATPGRPG